VSRADPILVQRLFEMEVPEIYDGTVQIRAAAREAGERTKIAVQSRDKDVDPVGACVGMKGMRVQSIIRELRGEKIDIIPYSEDTVTFAQKALSPAKVTRVQIIDPETRHLEIIVEDTQLSLAIGKKGQNVRLASKLIGWNVDIKSEEEKRQEIEAQMAALTAPGTPLSELQGIGPKTIEKIESHGISSIEKLADMTPEQLMEIPGIGEKMVEKIMVCVAAHFQKLESLQAEESSEVPVEASGESVAEESVETAAENASEGAASEVVELQAGSETFDEATSQAVDEAQDPVSSEGDTAVTGEAQSAENNRESKDTPETNEPDEVRRASQKGDA
jgi:N utilization substance protein A